MTQHSTSPRKRPESLRAGQSRLLEMIATDAPLGRTLGSLAELIEAQIGDVACAILLSDAEGRQLRLGGAGRLSATYRHAIDGLPGQARQ